MPLTHTGIILIPKEFCNVVGGTQLGFPLTLLGSLSLQVDKHTKYRDLYIYLKYPPSSLFVKLIRLSNLSVKQMETHKAYGQRKDTEQISGYPPRTLHQSESDLSRVTWVCIQMCLCQLCLLVK